MIAKQYLITGIIMGIIGVGMSLLLECNWRPEESFRILNVPVISGRQMAL
jgi:cytochrome c oxidase subunit 1